MQLLQCNASSYVGTIAQHWRHLMGFSLCLLWKQHTLQWENNSMGNFVALALMLFLALSLALFNTTSYSSLPLPILLITRCFRENIHETILGCSKCYSNESLHYPWPDFLIANIPTPSESIPFRKLNLAFWLRTKLILYSWLKVVGK